MLQLDGRLPAPGWRTRFAPAPTGFLHLGHLVNAMHVWGIARAFGGQVLLRIEDHDRTRCRPEYEAALLEDLDWLGLSPDVVPFMRQSDEGARYQHALDMLAAQQRVYACDCTRRDIERLAARAPGEEARYPGTCRDRTPSADSLARRVRMDGTVERFDDLRLGVQAQVPAGQCGDLLARDRHGSWTYQFAVTVDDMHQNIDVVIRGEDLLASTGRQLQLARLLGRTAPPRYLHHTLLRRADGAKLSKSSHDTALRERRAAGATREALFGEAALLAGLTTTDAPIGVEELPMVFASRAR